MTSIGVIKTIDNHLYIPTTRLHKEQEAQVALSRSPEKHV